MDPNETLRLITRLLDFIALVPFGDEGDKVDECVDDLAAWLLRGGFEPDWAAEPLATAYYDCRQVSAPKEGRPCFKRKR